MSWGFWSADAEPEGAGGHCGYHGILQWHSREVCSLPPCSSPFTRAAGGNCCDSIGVKQRGWGRAAPSPTAPQPASGPTRRRASTGRGPVRRAASQGGSECPRRAPAAGAARYDRPAAILKPRRVSPAHRWPSRAPFPRQRQSRKAATTPRGAPAGPGEEGAGPGSSLGRPRSLHSGRSGSLLFAVDKKAKGEQREAARTLRRCRGSPGSGRPARAYRRGRPALHRRPARCLRGRARQPARLPAAPALRRPGKAARPRQSAPRPGAEGRRCSAPLGCAGSLPGCPGRRVRRGEVAKR